MSAITENRIAFGDDVFFGTNELSYFCSMVKKIHRRLSSRKEM